MMRIGMGCAVVLSLVLGTVVRTQAGPFDPKQVPADAKWVAHVNYDAMKESVVVRRAWEKLLDRHPDADQKLDQAKDDWGINLKEDLHGTTIYGKTIGKHEGVMIVQAKVNKKVLLEKAEKAPDHKVTKAGDYDIHSWTHKDPHHGARTVFGAFHGDNAVVFASSADELKAALDVLDGKGATMPEEGAKRIPPGTILGGWVSGLAEAQLPVKAPLAKQVNWHAFVLGENNGQSFFHSVTVMTNEDVVGQVKTILDGLRALGTLHVGNNEKGKEMVKAVKIETEGKRVSVSWSGSADDVWDMIVLHAKIVKERRAKHAQELKEKK